VSGVDLLDEMRLLMKKRHAELPKNILFIPIRVNKDDGRIIFAAESPETHIANKNLLIFDSSMHTGGTMCRAVNEAIKLGASNIVTYSLVIKKGSCFIPTFWGMTIDDTDRIYFLLNEIPNSRLDSGPERYTAGKYRKIPYVHIERLSKEHLKKPSVKCGVRSLDRVTWSDRYYDMQSGEHNGCTFVLQTGACVVGYMTFHFSSPDCLLVSEIAVDKKYQSKGKGKQRRKGKGYGAILIRFADTWARQCNCRWVKLNAIEQKIPWYKSFDYELILGRDPIVLDDEKYFPMQHKVVYLPLRLTPKTD
jgi:GNAT superfamily N-acetyltransferase